MMVKGADTRMPAQLKGTSREDERMINDRKIKETFYQLLNAQLQEEAFAQWKSNLDKLDADVNNFTLSKGDKSFGFEFTDSGIGLSFNASDQETLDVAFATVACYQKAHAQHHKNEVIDFELSCNDPEEAERIIKQAMEKGINITKLSFYNTDDPDKGPKQPQPDLLKEIIAKHRGPSRSMSQSR
jgi:hypothetical protein